MTDLPMRSDCACSCHKGGMMHVRPCCQPDRMTDETVAVEQCDRDHAADILDGLGHFLDAKRVKLGHYDSNGTLAKVVRHRIAALASAREPIARDAVEAERICRDAADRATHQLERDYRWQPTRVHYEGLRNALRNAERTLAHPRPALDREAVAAIINPLAFKSLEATVAEWTAWMNAEHPNNLKLSAQIPSLAQEEYDKHEVTRLRALKKADAILALATPPASLPSESTNP